MELLKGKLIMQTKALIYCRVSSQRQVTEGGGLSSQQQRCKAYASSKGYEVAEVFHDDGVSGGLLERPSMRRLIAYLDDNLTENYVVIFDDLARFARDLKVHLQLKTELVMVRGAKLESPNFVFEDTPEGEFIENILASKAQLDRQQNRKQVIQKMKARLEMGYWSFCMPLGLVNVKDPIHGRILASRDPFASIYKEAIEQYRDGVLHTLDDVQEFVNKKYKEHDISHKMSLSNAKLMLTQILYAGYLEYKPWNVPLMEAKHEGFISIETYWAVQERLKGKVKPWHRKDYHLDFPLRPHVLCDSCGVPMSGSYNTGRNQIRYPHYYCRGKDCKYIWKTVARKTFEDQFKTLLSNVKPADYLIDLTRDVLLVEWNNRLENYSLSKGDTQSELKNVKREISNFAEMAGKASRSGEQGLVDVYEEEIKELVAKKKELGKNQKQDNYTDKDFGTASKKVFDALKKPMEMWESDEYNDRRTVLSMYFEENLRYDYFRGFGTATLAYPVSLITKNRPVQAVYVEMSSNELESKKTF